jgi:hypothetical protein
MRGELPRAKYDEKGRILCQICGQSFLTISPKHLLKKHNITYKEYFLRYPDAPSCTGEFGARIKYRRDRNAIFIEKMNVEKKTENPAIEEMIISEEVGEPVVEEYDERLEKLTQEASCLNPLDNEKNKVLNILRLFLSNVQKDYMIQIFNIVGQFQFEFITDFADPVLKLNVEFPNTFWHNLGRFDDPLRDVKLEEYGWKILRVYSKNPTIHDIEDLFKNN